MANRILRAATLPLACAALLSLGACATAPVGQVAPELQGANIAYPAPLVQPASIQQPVKLSVEDVEQPNDCKALVRTIDVSGKAAYDCDEWLGDGRYAMTVWSNNGRTVQPIGEFNSYRWCAAYERSMPDIRAIQAPDGRGFYEVDEIWCVLHPGH